MSGHRLVTSVALMILIFGMVLSYSAWAEIPKDQPGMLLLKEQRHLKEAVAEYMDRIHEYRLDLVNLKSDREWLDVKIKGISDQKRDVPEVLTEAVLRIDEKMDRYTRAMARLDALYEQHVKTLKKLDSKVRKLYGNPAPSWWVWDGGSPPWAGKHGSFAVKTEHRPPVKAHAAAHEERMSETSVHAVVPEHSDLAEILEHQIKTVDLENWVSLATSEEGFKLDVRLPILFGLGKADVASEYKQFLTKLTTLLKPYPVVIEVAGFPDQDTDDRKSFVANMAMGTKRAANVVKEMMGAGLPASSFRIISEGGHGDVTHHSDTPMNRRVEVHVLIKGKKHEA